MDARFLLDLVFLLFLFALALFLRRLLTPLFGHVFGPKGGGWSDLAKVFATTRPMPPQTFRRQNVAVGQIVYRRSMNVGFDDAGFYLQPGFPVSLAQKARLFIPWERIGKVTPRMFFFRRAAALALGEPPAGVVTVPMDVFDAAIRPHLPAEALRELTPPQA
ncbi:hypothetical protein K9U39_04225 [Rhodoblastus acidophilus]|uniref:DUF3592 domain-containing protein n=1 Tax=Candidatus Rhodoblastus alkanivorans TaxID=2954117 RepID=A0ABS9Z893_9HYPH|nr:hypothetical protein [Candidatus Rhodoblastus alkanivorans]MCI4678475.1 hypothetical protein [Candidatus Rhodoblastus alkanivorans]MCI4682852.1 hypothetical protein [Candidatus Rhodoblastus alkanivorans]MDI4640161.1 hypothetical protein [Rhodoblastus acidophilus]